MESVAKQVKTRRYDNAARLAKSGRTRQAILDAARTQMLKRGYRGTTIADIARLADVHVDTVYALVGRKAVLLRELIEQAISGSQRAIPAEERDYVSAIRSEPDPQRKLAIYAHAMRAIHARLAPLLLALRDASTTEPEARAVWKEISARRARNMRELAKDLESVGGIRTGMSIAEAGDIIWVTNSAEVYVLLTDERGWSARRYERWLTDTWARLVLPEHRS